MSEAPTKPSHSTPLAPGKTSDTAAGVSVLLAALAIGLSSWALWLVHSTYERHRGRTTDMAGAFAINFDLTKDVLPPGAAGGICLLVSGGLFLGWARRAGWTMRVGFVVQWLVAAAFVLLVVLSRLPLRGWG